MKYSDVLASAWEKHLLLRSSEAPTVISTFAGCGGSSLGYSMAGFRELLAVEWDDHAAAVFKRNFPDVPLYHGDIAKLGIQECLDRGQIQPGMLDVFDGSPPCQGFSTAGKRLLDDPRNGLFKEYVRLLTGLQPRSFVMENVAGMVKGKMKLAFAEIITCLKSCGYAVSARLVHIQYFNVPQARQRMVFIGTRNDLGLIPSHPKPLSNVITASRAIEDSVPATFNRPLATVGRNIWKCIKPGQNGTAFRAGYYFNTSKLHPNEPCPTIPKTFSGTGGILHWKEPRTLSIEELKRLGSFPDQFQLFGTFTEQAARIGNSVPPLFMKAIAEHIRHNILESAPVKQEKFLVKLGQQDAIKEALLQ